MVTPVQRAPLGSRTVAEQLTQGLFMPGDASPVEARDKIPLAVAFQRRQGKARVLRQEAVSRDAGVGEIAAPAARDANLFARSPAMFDHKHAPPAPSGLDRGKHACRPGADDDAVKAFHGPDYPAPRKGATRHGKFREMPLAALRISG